MSAQDSINLFAMKSFKALMFLTLAATLSCGANGSPTNITTDGYPTKPSPAALKDIMNNLQGIANVYYKKYGDDYASFTKAYVDRLGWEQIYNYVVCYVDHDIKFDGQQGQDWDHKYVSKPQKDAGRQPAILIDVVVGGSGTFTRKGKGGYENWAWKGWVAANQDMHSKVINFVKPPTGRQAEGAGD
ncbi:hypothetical protein JOM56_011683 [Amanita muscaria]